MTTLYDVTTGRTDITPWDGYPLAGYGVDIPRRATGDHSRLFARCTIIWADDVPHVVVTADVLGFGRSLHQRIRQQVTALGVATDNFVLTATHTHSGPVLSEKLEPYAAYNLGDTADVELYEALLLRQVVALVDEALFAVKTRVTLDYQTTAAGFSFNREGLPHDETEVPVLVARTVTGRPRAVLFGFGAHPVAANRTDTCWDADYPGFAAGTVEDDFPGVHAQFLLGPAGDQNPRPTTSDDPVARYGAQLGSLVSEAAATPGAAVAGSPRTVFEELTLPLAAVATEDAAVGYRRRLDDDGLPGYKRRHAERMLDKLSAGTAADRVQLPVQVWAFDGLILIFCGGELPSGFAVQTREAAGDDRVWVTGYANEVPGYIPTTDLLDHPCYAGGRDSDNPAIAGGSATVYDLVAPFDDRAPDLVAEHLRDVVRSTAAGSRVSAGR